MKNNFNKKLQVLNNREILLINGGNKKNHRTQKEQEEYNKRIDCLGKCFSVCHLTYGLGEAATKADTGMEQWCINNCHSKCGL